MTEILFARYTDVQTLLAGSLRFDIAQSLTATQQQQAIANLGGSVINVGTSIALAYNGGGVNFALGLRNETATNSSNTVSINMNALNSAGVNKIQGNITSGWASTTSGSEEGTLSLDVIVGGVSGISGLLITGGASGSPSVSIPGTLNLGTSTSATVGMPTGSGAILSVQSANTGNTNNFQVFNTGTASTSGTNAEFQVQLNAANAYTALVISGGSTITGGLSTGASVSGGLTISTGAGGINLAPNNNAVNLPGVAFASLPGSPSIGMIAYVTDSTTNTWGATISGSGSDKVMAWYNGTNWTVMGK
jgi:hypothetical protein